MRIGVITDIHSNIQALNVILSEFNKLKVDRIICCGDIVGIGINPEEVVKKLIVLKDELIAVRGNHESYLIDGLPQIVHDDKRSLSQGEIDNHNWNKSKLSNKSIKFLKNLKMFQEIELANKKNYVVHYPIKNDGSYKKIMKAPSNEEIQEMFKEHNSDIFLYGHTHKSCVIQINEKCYINTGSLGCPYESNVAKADLLEIVDGKIKFKSIEVEYDVEKVKNEIKEIKVPFYDKILEIFYGQR